MKGYPTKLLKIRVDDKFTRGYPRMFFKTKYLVVITDYLIVK